MKSVTKKKTLLFLFYFCFSFHFFCDETEVFVMIKKRVCFGNLLQLFFTLQTLCFFPQQQKQQQQKKENVQNKQLLNASTHSWGRIQAIGAVKSWHTLLFSLNAEVCCEIDSVCLQRSLELLEDMNHTCLSHAGFIVFCTSNIPETCSFSLCSPSDSCFRCYLCENTTSRICKSGGCGNGLSSA